jgi:hypothetical protein
MGAGTKIILERKQVRITRFGFDVSMLSYVRISMSEDLFFTQDGLNLSYIEDFKRTFQNPFDARVVVKAADGYLTHVEKMVRVFRDVFAVDA